MNVHVYLNWKHVYRRHDRYQTSGYRYLWQLREPDKMRGTFSPRKIVNFENEVGSVCRIAFNNLEHKGYRSDSISLREKKKSNSCTRADVTSAPSSSKCFPKVIFQ